MDEIAREQGVAADAIEVWFADEARIGQKNKITRRWARRGSRPSAPQDQRTASTYIFGAICPERGEGAGLVLPWCNTEAMALHLAAISAKIAPGHHAALLVDQAGWHLSPRLPVPANITIVPLPAKRPELNPQENVWQFMRDNWLSNRVFQTVRIRAIFRRQNTSKPAVGHKIYPYLLRGMKVDRPSQVWAMDIIYIPMARGFVYLVAVVD